MFETQAGPREDSRRNRSFYESEGELDNIAGDGRWERSNYGRAMGRNSSRERRRSRYYDSSSSDERRHRRRKNKSHRHRRERRREYDSSEEEEEHHKRFVFHSLLMYVSNIILTILLYVRPAMVSTTKQKGKDGSVQEQQLVDLAAEEDSDGEESSNSSTSKNETAPGLDWGGGKDDQAPTDRQSAKVFAQSDYITEH